MATALVTGGNDGIFQAEAAGAPITLNAPLTLANQTATPASPAGGGLLYATGGQPSYVNPQGLATTLVGCLGGLTAAGAAITGTTSETVLTTATIPISDAVAGSCYQMTGFGVFSTTSSPGSTVFTSRLGGTGGTSLAATANITLGTSLTNAQFQVEAFLNFLSTTTVNCLVKVIVNSAAAGATSAYLAASTSAVTVSLSTAKAWVIDITPGASGNSIQLLGSWASRVC